MPPRPSLVHPTGDARIVGVDQIAPEIVGFNSRDKRSRPFNLLRAQVLKLARAHGFRIIGVTAATPRVGKSFIASNLAAAIARTPEVDTYLFDLDLRRGSIGQNFGLKAEVGITEYLQGEVDNLDPIGWQVEGQRLSIFPSFVQRVASAELLGGPRMDELIAAMRRLPDSALCLVDLPPVFANDDAVVVVQKIDAYLLVIEDGVTTRKQVRDAVNLLKPAVCMGSVLNRYRGGIGGDDYGYSYGQSGKYDDYYG